MKSLVLHTAWCYISGEHGQGKFEIDHSWVHIHSSKRACYRLVSGLVQENKWIKIKSTHLMKTETNPISRTRFRSCVWFVFPITIKPVKVLGRMRSMRMYWLLLSGCSVRILQTSLPNKLLSRWWRELESSYCMHLSVIVKVCISEIALGQVFRSLTRLMLVCIAVAVTLFLNDVNPFTPKFKKYIRELVKIGSIMISHLSKLRKAKFFILCDVIFLAVYRRNLILITLGSERI